MSGLVDVSADARSKTIGQNFRCRAWVTFNGTGTVGIDASSNVSSITDNGTGQYQMNFTSDMPDSNYCTLGTTNDNAGLISHYGGTYDQTTARVFGSNSTTGGTIDWSRICVAVFR